MNALTVKNRIVYLQEMSVEQYVYLLDFQKDRVKRHHMKQLAFYAVHSGHPAACVQLPIPLMPEISEGDL